MTIRIAVLVFVLAAPVGAQTLADNTEGRVDVAGNELKVESKINDPAAVRVGAPATQNGLGKISWDVLGASRDEVVLLQGKQTPDGRRGGVFWAGIKKPGFGWGDDAAMHNWLEVSYEGGVRFHLPVYAPNLSPGGGVAQDHLVGGAWQFYVQTDGNLVLYEIVAAVFCPRWAISWLHVDGAHGFIDRATLAPPCNQ